MALALPSSCSTYPAYDLEQVIFPSLVLLSLSIQWGSSKCLLQGEVLKIRGSRLNKLRHGKASGTVPVTQQMFKTCWFTYPSFFNDEIRSKIFHDTSFPQMTAPESNHGIHWERKSPRPLPSRCLFQFLVLSLGWECWFLHKKQGHLTTPPHPTPALNMVRGELLLPETTGRLHNPLPGENPASPCSPIHSNAIVSLRVILAPPELALEWKDSSPGEMLDFRVFTQ